MNEPFLGMFGTPVNQVNSRWFPSGVKAVRIGNEVFATGTGVARIKRRFGAKAETPRLRKKRQRRQ